MLDPVNHPKWDFVWVALPEPQHIQFFADNNNNNNILHVPAQVLGVCGTSLVSPGWLVHSVTIRAKDVQLLKIRQNNVIPDLSRSTWRVWTFDLTKQHDLGQSTVYHPANMSIPPEPLAPELRVHRASLTHWQNDWVWNVVLQRYATKMCLKHLIKKTDKAAQCLLSRVHVSAPYKSTERTIDWKIWSLV